MEYIEVTGKSVDEAITNACLKLETSSDKIEYEVIDKGSNGLFGIFNSKPAKIKARVKSGVDSVDEEFKEFEKNEKKVINETIEVKKEASKKEAVKAEKAVEVKDNTAEHKALATENTVEADKEETAVKAEVRLYENLVDEEKGKLNADGTLNLNPNSLRVLKECYLEPGLKEAKPFESFQFVRNGYFCVDCRDSESRTNLENV